MKLTTFNSKLATVLAVALINSFVAMSQVPVHYQIKDLGVVGPSPGQPFQITSNGLISGAVVSGGVSHATLWYQRFKLNIGGRGLGGKNSLAFGANDRLQVVGEAETSTTDPNHEDFCGFKASGLTASGTCLPFIWWVMDWLLCRRWVGPTAWRIRSTTPAWWWGLLRTLHLTIAARLRRFCSSSRLSGTTVGFRNSPQWRETPTE